MLTGVYNIGGVIEESICRSSEDYRFTDVGVYKIHSNVLMANIKFAEAKVSSRTIKPSIFLNENPLKIPSNIDCQNYLTTKYIGRAPLEFYSGKEKTKMGRQFILLCREGNPNADYRVFGTEQAIRGFNKNAGDLNKLPGGGDN